MPTHYHGDIEIEWTQGEYRRLQAIKAAKWEGKGGRKRGSSVVCDVTAGFQIPSDLRAKVFAYAKEKGVSFSGLMRNVCVVLTQEDE